MNGTLLDIHLSCNKDRTFVQLGLENIYTVGKEQAITLNTEEIHVFKPKIWGDTGIEVDIDVAVIEMSETARWGKDVEPIAKIASTTSTDIPHGSIYHNVGWGATDKTSRGLVEELNYVTYSFLRTETFNGTDSYTPQGPDHRLLWKSESGSGCPGDSGGPMFTRESDNSPWLLSSVYKGATNGTRDCITDDEGVKNRINVSEDITIPEVRNWIMKFREAPATCLCSDDCACENTPEGKCTELRPWVCDKCKNGQWNHNKQQCRGVLR